MLKLLLILVIFCTQAFAGNSRVINADSVRNATSLTGYLYIPTVTPTAGTAAIFDGSSIPSSSVTTSAELAFLSGVTSSVQTQLNGKQASLTFSAPLVNTANTIAINGVVADNKLSFVNASDVTKQLTFDLSGQTTSTTLTAAPQNTSSMTLHIPQVATASGAGMALVQDETTGFIFSNGISSSIGAANSMMQLANASTANRAQIKLHSYFNGASVAGVSTLTSRSGTIAVNSSISAGQDYSKWTAQAAAATAGSAPISGTFSFKANAINSLTVPSDFHIQLTNTAGTLADRFYLTSEGLLQLPGYSTGLLHSDSSGNITSSAVNLASADVTGLLPITNMASSPVTKKLYVDGNRSDSYTADGSILRPFKTIQAAINQVITNADNASFPYHISVATGGYSETLTLANAALYNLVIESEAYSQGELNGTNFGPGSGTAITSTSNNTNLQNLAFTGFTINGDVIFTGNINNTNFCGAACVFIGCNIQKSSSGILATNVNNLYFYDSAFNSTGSGPITLNNVAFGLLEQGDGIKSGITLNLVDNPGGNVPAQYAGNYLLMERSTLSPSTIAIDAGSELDTVGGYLGGGTITNNGT